MVAIVWLVWVQIRGLRRADELQRVQQLEAMSIGFGVTIVLLAGVGLLDGAGIGDLAQQSQTVFLLGVAAWVSALALISTRSR